MATTEEEVTDFLWEEMKIWAVEQQQCLYELLPNCTVYKSDEHEYLKQNIGYAIYGPPKNTEEDANNEENINCYFKTENPNNTDVTDTVGYDEKAQKIIDKIYNKICTCTKTDNSQPICVGIIYNLIFRPKTNVKPKNKGVKKEAKREAAKEEAKTDEKEVLIVMPVPIFKIDVEEKSETTKRAKQSTSTAIEAHQPLLEYDTWYIDLTGRVYKNWTDYKENNTLPQCTMVLPKHGFYEPNPAYPITEDYSTVFLEIMDSPACAWKAKLCKGVDVVSSVVGFGSVGLTIASLFTPLAPVVVVSGLAAASVTGAWTLGRNSQQLVDRNSHEESINVLNKEALPHYLGIFGTVLGLGAMGGSAVISNVAARGMTVNTLARVAFNTVQGGTIVLNGVGVIYQGYYMYDKYKTDETVSAMDALNLATHLMFFCGSVVKVQFASDIIESSQGRIINDYKETLSNKRLRKKWNRIARNANENNTCNMSKNAEMIRYIKHRQELLSNQSVTNDNSRISNTSRNVVWSIERGRLKVNNITLLDPIEFVTRLIKLGIFIEIDQNDSSVPRNNADDSIVEQLSKILCNLLSALYLSDDCPKSMKLSIVPDFEPLIREMSSMYINGDYLRMLFKIAEKLMKRSKNMDDLLLQTFTFVWQYCKANLKQWGMSLRYCTQSISSNKILQRIIIAIFEAIDMMVNNLHDAFVMYVLQINGE